MKIKLDDKFVISSDNNSFTLSSLTEKKKEDNDKEPTLKFIGSYGDLASALRGYIKNESRGNDVTLEVGEIIDYFTELENRINTKFKGMK